MTGRFFDTNVLIYIFERDSRADIAEALLLRGGIVSVQVFNEFVHVCRHKKKLPLASVCLMLDRLRPLCHAVPVTLDHHFKALSISARYGFSTYDSLIVAAALEAGCDELYTEDLQDGQRIEDRLVTVNPFK